VEAPGASLPCDDAISGVAGAAARDCDDDRDLQGYASLLAAGVGAGPALPPWGRSTRRR
jgi:hypothetical protein